ncbi:hypothetical protein G1K66_12905 [Tenacibaculum finnmarkense]|uniref:Histidine kinase n=1 Tax=Tenacibaculum piscium TaxID=1458515 RepID=A0A2H1YJK7_9FLAO|nr:MULTISPECIES: hypothetical protein [Tenacibaculum]MBE7630505.1 hypothetical protein [Tenacibaculum piscium]MBE7671692.1 hypothetical protein [Tenacibaculum piscium]MCD8401468.1 hypothetical protein [Tenacibaculum finnmarkense genomovar ulcerans]MCG8814153.1 hypothetical protein [Tenacibaculum finnmarkense]SOS75696.1 conserved hypothetical protein [Tenacibaculum piscium]
MNKTICFLKEIKDYQIIIGFIITISGWVINNNYNKNRDRLNELNRIKNSYISNAYQNISFYATLHRHNVHTKDYFIKFENSLKDIQLYGTPNEIHLAKKLMNDLQKSSKEFKASFDPLLNELRTNLRKTYNLEVVKGNTFWIFDTKLWEKNIP